MAFPQVASSTNSIDDAANSTTQTVNLPAVVNNGDLLIAGCSTDGNETHTWPGSGVWNKIFDLSDGTVSLSIAWRAADGTEDGGTVDIGTGSQRSAGFSYAISGAADPAIDPPEVSTGATGSSVNPAPDAVTASWGSDDNLFIVVHGSDRAVTTTGFPTNYVSNQENNAGGGANSAGICAASDELASASDASPGTFTISSTEGWSSCSVVVRPESIVIVTNKGTSGGMSLMSGGMRG